MVDSDAKTPEPMKPKPTTPALGAEGGRHALMGLREEMDRLFDDFFTSFPFGGARRRRLAADPWRRVQGVFEATFPAVDVSEDEGSYRITAELPGMEEKDIELAVVRDVLTLKGEKKEQRETREENAIVSERRYGSFQRSFPLPEDADVSGIEASFKNGVLTVTLPRKAEAQASRRKIDIKTTTT